MPSIATLREVTGMRLQSMQDAMKTATTWGYLFHKRGGGRNNPNLYLVKTPKEDAGELLASYRDCYPAGGQHPGS